MDSFTPEELVAYAHERYNYQPVRRDKQTQNHLDLIRKIIKATGVPVDPRHIKETGKGKPYYPLTDGFRLQLMWSYGKPELWVARPCEYCGHIAYLNQVFHIMDIGFMLSKNAKEVFNIKIGGFLCSVCREQKQINEPLPQLRMERE